MFYELFIYIYIFFTKSLFGRSSLLYGALTSKYYAYKSRSWELEVVEILDFFDSFLNLIRVDLRGTKILRILPRIGINDSLISAPWISNKSRFAFDGLSNNRIENPFIADKNSVKKKENSLNYFVKQKWETIFPLFNKFLFKNILYTKSILKMFLGGFKSLNDSLIIKDFINLIGFRFFIDIDIGNYFLVDQRYYFLNNIDFSILKSNCFFLLGFNPRLESVYVNLKLKENLKKNNFLKIFSFGSFNSNYIYKSLYFSNNLKYLFKLFEGRSKNSLIFSNSNNPIFLLGSSFFQFVNHINVFKILEYYFNFYTLNQNFFCNWFNIIFSNSSVVNILESGIYHNLSLIIKQLKYSKTKIYIFLFYCGLSFINVNIKFLQLVDFVFYQNHHFSVISQWSDIILPVKSVFESDVIYLNCDGYFLKSFPISIGLNFAKQIWKIFLIFSENLFPFKFLSVNDIIKLRYIYNFNYIYNNLILLLNIRFNIGVFLKNKEILCFNLIKNYYSMDIISYFSSYFHLCKIMTNKLLSFN